MSDMLAVTVIVPLGPREAHTRWLDQCLDSVVRQVDPGCFIEVIVLDDAPQLGREKAMYQRVLAHPWSETAYPTFYTNPWPLGDSDSFNVGVGLCKTPFFFFLSCDDWIEPDCMALLSAAYYKHPDPLGLYWPVINVVNDDGVLTETMNLPCSHSLISTDLWKYMGGVPPQGGIGHGDTFCMNMLLSRMSDHVYPVEPKKGLYNYRVHTQQASAHDGAYFGLIQQARAIYQESWRPMIWHSNK